MLHQQSFPLQRSKTDDLLLFASHHLWPIFRVTAELSESHTVKSVKSLFDKSHHPQPFAKGGRHLKETSPALCVLGNLVTSNDMSLLNLIHAWMTYAYCCLPSNFNNVHHISFMPEADRV